MTDKQTAPKARFTPGPWFVGAQNDGLYVLDRAPSPTPYDGPIPRAHGPNVVATPNWRLPAYEANAALIAAAPTMLKALKRLIAERDDDPERYPLEPTCNECTEGLTPLAHDKGLCHWHEARAAIAAAEGR